MVAAALARGGAPSRRCARTRCAPRASASTCARYTLLAFAIGSAYGGFAGALYAPLVEFIDPAPFALGPSLLFLLMVVIGGAGSFVGPFIGAGVAVLLPEWLRFAESYYLIIYAVAGDGDDGVLPDRHRRPRRSASEPSAAPAARRRQGRRCSGRPSR